MGDSEGCIPGAAEDAGAIADAGANSAQVPQPDGRALQHLQQPAAHQAADGRGDLPHLGAGTTPGSGPSVMAPHDGLFAAHTALRMFSMLPSSKEVQEEMSNAHHESCRVECDAALQEVPQHACENGHVCNVQYLQWQRTDGLAAQHTVARMSSVDPIAALVCCSGLSNMACDLFPTEQGLMLKVCVAPGTREWR